ncbi:hypothetical protein SPRG_19094 [Saprolegnia parasitica CBS 223.65]|uniref:Uncharacterized protein n=1 Tax=Saprolegnia parasitica (strain CBS 223.65) TaxID=695850 RepID=A0A067CUV4_SAPPC|nr:hypothetical protein SPRG_19094 [Saprolegnia parasitica CBS 223.65]KDO34273.1 hypothetical protein SPRG_19094 [Saprolegnia parasitica CBS 223.65]|eukprot:XP_012195290.1 hypothetical protein SPRG_19094 [Saprolegnia parasitica CBS 223.65]
MDLLLLGSVFARLRRKRAADQQQVLDELVAHEDGKLLRMRPNLRAFHTRLASLSNIHESASLNMFRITRVRDLTISQTMACELLTKLITPSILSADAADARRRHPYKSQWCVFDAKLRSKSPATDYKVLLVYD